MIFYEKLNSGQLIKRTRQKFSFAKFEGCGWHWLESVQLFLLFFCLLFFFPRAASVCGKNIDLASNLRGEYINTYSCKASKEVLLTASVFILG